MVTHDQEEALSISDRIAVMNQGRIVQCGTPADIYDEPVDRFVSEFVGTMNLIPGELLSTEGTIARFRFGNGYGFSAISRGPIKHPGRVLVGVRPENLALSEPGGGGMDGEILGIVPLGPLTQIHVRLLAGLSVIVSVAGRLDRPKLAIGAPVSVSVGANSPCSVFEP